MVTQPAPAKQGMIVPKDHVYKVSEVPGTQYIFSQESLLVPCRGYLEELHALPGCRRQENNVYWFLFIFVGGDV